MQAQASPRAVQGEVIEIESDNDYDYEDQLFDTFLDLTGTHELYQYPPELLGDQAQTWPLPPVAPAPVALSSVIVDPNILYQLYLDCILEVFPDICRDHAKSLYDAEVQNFAATRTAIQNNELSEIVIRQILDNESYPRETDKRRVLKRKRQSASENELEEQSYMFPGRPRLTIGMVQEARMLLIDEFSTIPFKYIDQQLKERGNIYATYLALELTERTFHQIEAPPYKPLSKRRKIRPLLPEAMNPDSRPMVPGIEVTDHGSEQLKKELLAAKRTRERQELALRTEKLRADTDAALEKQCRANGEMVECQCCFTDTPLPKSTHCEDSHLFCLECAMNYAKSQAELSRYELTCMDSSGCRAGFSRSEKHRFLDTQLLARLDRLQQQAELRAANLENLESCPFCEYAAIYPPVEEDREFRCKAPDCEAVSCRFCKAVTHLPMTCAEYKKEQGVSERHVLEEAMTNALVRECPKCKVPILKDGGCNKMTCSQCRTCVCDYCGKDITKEGYGHFENGVGRNPPARTKCPTQDDTHSRNKQRIAEAQKEAMAKIRTENPDISEEDLNIKFSVAVQAEPDSMEAHYRRDIGAPRPLPPALLRRAMRPENRPLPQRRARAPPIEAQEWLLNQPAAGAPDLIHPNHLGPRTENLVNHPLVWQPAPQQQWFPHAAMGQFLQEEVNVRHDNHGGLRRLGEEIFGDMLGNIDAPQPRVVQEFPIDHGAIQNPYGYLVPMEQQMTDPFTIPRNQQAMVGYQGAYDHYLLGHEQRQ